MAKKKPTKKKKAVEDAAVESEAVPFEESLQALKEVLGDLEEGNLPLGESLEKYEAGIRHLRSCHQSLKQARARIELLVKIDKDGKAVTQPFEHTATFEEVSEEDADALQEELDEETGDDGDWDGGLF